MPCAWPREPKARICAGEKPSGSWKADFSDTATLAVVHPDQTRQYDTSYAINHVSSKQATRV
jgi:hypothetical protein